MTIQWPHAIIIKSYADMAELADAHDSGSCEHSLMQVQVLLSASEALILLSFNEIGAFFVHWAIRSNSPLHKNLSWRVQAEELFCKTREGEETDMNWNLGGYR